MTKTRNRLRPDERRAELLDAALWEAEAVGYNFIRREDIAARVDVSPALVTAYFGTMVNLRRDVVRAAIRDGWHVIIVQAIVAKSPLVKGLTEEQRAAAIASL